MNEVSGGRESNTIRRVNNAKKERKLNKTIQNETVGKRM